MDRGIRAILIDAMRGNAFPRLLLVAAAAAALVFLASGGTDAPRCAMCGREECRNLAFTIRLAEGGVVDTCCPRCAVRFLEREKPDVARLEVRDFATAKSLDARAAFYVEGSDVHPCAMDPEGPPKDERGCCMKAIYDRCLPSALAFGDRASAESFAKDHGGFVTTFAQLGSEPRISQRRTRP